MTGVPRLAPPLAAPLPDVTTERLDLRRFRPDDLDELAEVFSHREVWEFPFGRAFSRRETERFLDEQLDEWDELGMGCWIARTRDDGRVVGYLGLSVPTFLPEILPAVEVGWRLAPSVWRRGYATEGATAALDQAFTTLGLESVCSLPQSDNAPSVRVAERLGMTRVGDVVVAATDRRGAVTVAHFDVTARAWNDRATPARPPA